MHDVEHGKKQEKLQFNYCLSVLCLVLSFFVMERMYIFGCVAIMRAHNYYPVARIEKYTYFGFNKSHFSTLYQSTGDLHTGLRNLMEGKDRQTQHFTSENHSRNSLMYQGGCRRIYSRMTV